LHFGCCATYKENNESYSSQHGDEDGYSLSLCCKFEINWRLLAIWLVVIKFTPVKAGQFVGTAILLPAAR